MDSNDSLLVALGLSVPEPGCVPAGNVTTVVRTQMHDKQAADYLGSLVTSSEITESMIDQDLAEHMALLSAQDDLIETADGKITGLRLSTVPRATGC